MSSQGQKLRIASLFSGCGGFDLGFVGDFDFMGKHFSKLPTNIVFANDFDNDAAVCFNEKISKYDADASCIEEDVRDISISEIPDYDVLLAGFPCQPFSNAGLRGGVNDKHNRGTLFEECERILKGNLTVYERGAAESILNCGNATRLGSSATPSPTSSCARRRLPGRGTDEEVGQRGWGLGEGHITRENTRARLAGSG